jgi:folate-dependent tRNA-U54 methylase TrmFO/GidA
LISGHIAYRASIDGNLDAEAEVIILNCPMTRDEYNHFVDELLNAEKIILGEFEKIS